ncbi:MFS transporter [Spirillospora sp. NPDC047279]|uniref:MFS transporter n=1 Tax=Spirillospora sp. NPDC047279 TaxID=3155478 RepID=UPI0033C30471
MIIGGLRRARVAVTVAFAVHGMISVAWAARIPQIKEHLGLSEGALGVAMLGAPLGVVAAVRFAGRIVERWGSRATTVVAGLVGALSLVPLGLAWNLGSLTISLLVMGAALGLMDVAMNAQGVVVERRYGRPLMSGLHGAYSVGNLVIVLVGSAAAHAAVPVPVHLSCVALVLTGFLLLVARDLLDPSADVMPVADGGPGLAAGDGKGGGKGGGTGGGGTGRGGGPRAGRAVMDAGMRWRLALLGIIGLCSFVGEGGMADWSAVHLRETLDTGPGVAGLGFAGFSVAMTAGRLVGDRVVARFGPVRVLRVSSLIGAAGLALGLLAGHPAAAVAGFTLFGVGAAAVAPVTFSAAGNLPGVPAAVGISRVTAVGYLGLLGGPPVIGFVAQAVGLGWALAIPAVLIFMIFFLAGATATARS